MLRKGCITSSHPRHARKHVCMYVLHRSLKMLFTSLLYFFTFSFTRTLKADNTAILNRLIVNFWNLRSAVCSNFKIYLFAWVVKLSGDVQLTWTFMCTIAQKSFVILGKCLKIEAWDISVVLDDRKDLSFRLFLFDTMPCKHIKFCCVCALLSRKNWKFTDRPH